MKGVYHLSRLARIQLIFDRYSRWMPSLGRNTADGMDESLGLLSYSCLSVPLGRRSGRNHNETRAACIALLTNEGYSLLGASITSHA